MPIRQVVGRKEIHRTKRRLGSIGGSGRGSVAPHTLLGVIHSDTAVNAPVQGALVLADSTPEWTALFHPAVAGAALTTDATDVMWDQTPTWTGRHSWDDGAGVTAYIDEDGSADFDGHVAIGDLATVNTAYGLNLQEEFTDVAGTVAGMRFQARGTPGAGSAATVYGAFGQSQANAAVAHTGSHIGMFGQALAVNTIAATGLTLVGVKGNTDVEDAAAGLAAGGLFTTPAVDTGSATAGYGLQITQGVVGAGSITTLYGLNIAAITAGGTNWSIYTAGGDWNMGAGDLYVSTAHGFDFVDDANGDFLKLAGGLYVPGDILVTDVPGLDAQFVTMALSGDLANERVLVGGDAITLTDGGAGGNATLDLDTPGTLTVSTVNTAAGAHLHTVTSSSNPGAAASLLASAADGGLQLIRLGIGVDPNADNLIRMVDDAAIGLSSATGRIVFNETGADAIEITDADLEISTTARGITHVDGVAAGQIFVANGTRYLPGTIADAGGAPNDAQYLTLALDGDLSAERRFVPGNGLAGTDGGADGDYDLVVDLVAAWSGLEFSGGDLRIDLDAVFDAWTGVHTHAANVVLDDNVGNSPQLQFIPANNDTLFIMADNDAVVGSSDLRIALADAAGESHLYVRDSAGAFAFGVDSDGNATVGANLIVPRYIIHDGDVDTYLDFTADQIAIWAGAAQLLTITEAATNTILFGAQADLNGNDLIIDTDGDTYLHESADDVISIAIAGNAQYQLDATQLTISTTVPAAVLYLRTAGDVQSTSADIYEANALGLAAANSVHVFVDANDGGTDAYFAVHMDAENLDDADISELWRVTETNEMMMRKDGVNHGATDIVRTTDTFYQVSNVDTSGGAILTGAKDSTGAAGGAMVVRGLLDENADTTKTTAGRAIVEVYGGQSTGTGWDNVVADGNIVAFRTRASGAWATRFIFDTEGSAHADIEWTTFDEHDDVALLDALESSFGEFAEDHQADLERLKIATYDGTPGHAMVNWTRLAMLHTGAIRQLGQRLERYKKALLEMGANPALLEAQ